MRHLLVFLLSVLSLIAADNPQPCPFCEIVAGTRPAAVVYRDPTVMAFLSIGPRNPGHVLVIPVQHAENFLTLPPATARELIAVAQRIATAIKRTDLQAEGIQLQMNTGKAAGQTVFHAHLHVIPRFAGEPEPRSEKDRATLAELEPIAAKIRAKLQ
jgi:diadenosine tetraphosphate (Ap4A) HIT family hydrolase